MKLTRSECQEILYLIATQGAHQNIISKDHKSSGLYAYLQYNVNTALSDSRCEQIIQCIVHNYKPNSNPMNTEGRVISWEDWLRDMVGAEPQTYEEFIKETSDG